MLSLKKKKTKTKNKIPNQMDSNIYIYIYLSYISLLPHSNLNFLFLPYVNIKKKKFILFI